jgi:putative membrane protein
MGKIIDKALAILLTAAAFALVGPVTAEDAATTKFLTDAIRSNLGEIKLGELAEQRGRSEEVRDFAEALIADHTRSLHETSELASKLGVIPPTESGLEGIKQHEALSRLQGEAFDRAFATQMVSAHQRAIETYTEQAKSAANPEVAKLAESLLPTLRQHLAHAQALQRDGPSGG